MTDEGKLVIVKTIHTLVWIFFNVVIFYLFYAVVTDQIDKWFWICLLLIFLEGLVLLVFRNVCPITNVARQFSNSNKDNFDIYLPNWLAKYNKQIYTSIVVICVIILIFRMMN